MAQGLVRHDGSGGAGPSLVNGPIIPSGINFGLIHGLKTKPENPRYNKIFQHNYVDADGLPKFPLEAAFALINPFLAPGNARKGRSFPEISSIVDVERRGQSLLNLLHGLP